MSQPLSGYLLGIGSNIEPHKNIPLVIRELLRQFPQITLSRVLTIPPVGMNSRYFFLNVVIFIETEQSQNDLKTVCNTIEIKLGRDRNAPMRKIKDRTADLDILTRVQFPNDFGRPVSSITDEYFLYPLLEEISAYLSEKPYSLSQCGVEINIGHLTLGKTATTIYRDTNTCYERIIKQTLHD